MRKIRNLALMLAGVVSLGACSHLPYHHSKAEDAKEVETALNAWTQAVSSGDADKVVSLYQPDAVLLATCEPKPITTQEGRKAYYGKMTSKKKDVKVTVTELHTRVMGDVAEASGLYNFSFSEMKGKKKTKTMTVPARFSFTYLDTKDGWKIVDHHSSEVPKKR